MACRNDARNISILDRAIYFFDHKNSVLPDALGDFDFVAHLADQIRNIDDRERIGAKELQYRAPGEEPSAPFCL
jgi:hypothetical protein